MALTLVATPLPKSALATVPLMPFAPPDPVTLSGAGGHIKRAQRSRIELRALLARALQSVRIAKASGLDFLYRSIHGCRLGASEIAHVDQLRTCSTRHLDLRSSELVDHYLRRLRPASELRDELPSASTSFGCSKTGTFTAGSSLALIWGRGLIGTGSGRSDGRRNQFGDVILRELQLFRQKQPEVNDDEQQQQDDAVS